MKLLHNPFKIEILVNAIQKNISSEMGKLNSYLQVIEGTSNTLSL